MQGLGNCYRMKVRDTECGNIEAGEFLDREIIAQAINTGSDVANIQFDLQIGKPNKWWGYRRPRIVTVSPNYGTNFGTRQLTHDCN